MASSLPKIGLFYQGIAWAVPWFVFLLLPFMYFFSENLAVLAFEIFSGVSTFFLLLQQIKRTESISFAASILGLVFSIWLLLLARGTFYSLDFSTSWPVFLKVFALVLLFYSVTAVAESDFFKKQLLRAATFTGLLHGLMAIQEYVEAPPIPATWVDPALKEHVRTRCAGIFTDPNIFGAFLAVVFVFILVAAFRAETIQQKAYSGASLFLTGFALLTTLSRGSWIALTAGLFCFFFVAVRNRRNLAADLHFFTPLLVMALILAIALIGPFKYRIFSISSSKDMTIAQRSLINTGIKKNLNNFPALGYGLHSFNLVYPRFRVVGGDYPMNAHNEFIQSMIETGFLSAALLFGLFLLTFIPGLISASSLVGAASTGSLLCLFVHNLGGFSSRILPTAVFIAFTAAMSWRLGVSCSRRLSVAPLVRKLFLVATVVLLLPFIGFSAKSFYINHLLEKAQTDLVQGRTDNALAGLDAVAALDPANAMAAGKKSDIHSTLGQKEKALLEVEKAIRLNAAEALYWLKLARLIAESDPQRSETAYLQAIALDPASELFRLEFAHFLVKTGQKQRAVAQLDEALSYSPGFHQVYRHYLVIEALRAELTGQK